MTNCINCGAVLTGKVCEYCGTIYSFEFADEANEKLYEKEWETTNPSITLAIKKMGVSAEEMSKALQRMNECLKKRGVNKNDI